MRLTSIRWLGWARKPDWRSTRHRPASDCGSDGAMRARVNSRTSSPLSCAPTTPSRPRPAAAPTSRPRRRCRRTSANGNTRSSSWRGRSPAARTSTRSPPSTSPALSIATHNSYCRQGLGTLLAKLVPPNVLQTDSPVNRIMWWGRGPIEVQTNRAFFTARAVIVTASTNVLTSGKIKFQPELPKRHLEARDAAQARKLRPHRARTAGQSAGIAARRTDV